MRKARGPQRASKRAATRVPRKGAAPKRKGAPTAPTPSGAVRANGRVAELERALAEALEQQTAVAEVLEVISRTTDDLKPVFDAIVQKAVALVGADSASLLLRDGDVFLGAADVQSGFLREPTAEEADAYREARERERSGVVPGDRRTLTGRVAGARRTVQVPDTVLDPDLYPEMPRASLATLVRRTLLGVPLLREGEVIGVIVARHNEPQPFTERQIAILETFARQAAIAIENVRLFNESRETLEQQTAVSDILTTLSRSMFDLEPVLQHVVDHAARLAQADQAWIATLEGEQLRTHAYHGPDAVMERFAERQRSRGGAWLLAVERIPSPFLRTELHESSSLALRPVQVEDARAVEIPDDAPMQVKVTMRSGVRTVLYVPLLRDGVAIGAFVLARNVVRPFSDRELALITAFADQAVIAIENVRLFNETKEALERQTAVSEILKVISSSPDSLQPVFDAIASATRRFCGAEDAAVLLIRDGAARVVAHEGLLPAGGPSVVLDRQTVTGAALLDKRTIHVEDVIAVEDFPMSAQHGRSGDGQRTVLATPLLRAGEAIGGILLRRAEPRAFTPRQIDLVETFAAQAAIAIENVRLFNETQQALEQQTATSDVLRVVSTSVSDLRPVFDAIVERARTLCGADDAWAMEFTAEKVRRWAYRGTTPHLQRLAQGLGEWRKVDEWRTTGGRAFLEQRVVQVSDLSDPVEVPYTPMRGEARTVLAVPLLRADGAMGVIMLARQEVRRFTDAQVDLVRTFADQAVIAIENARLIEEIRDKSAEIEAASRHKSEFLANMSHELRTPLNAVIGFSDVLEQGMAGPLSEKQAEYVRDISGSGKHLLDLVNEILDLSKVEAGRMDLEPSDFSLADTIQSAMAFIRDRAARHGIQIASDLAPDLGTLTADERKVRQVLLNLLSNAVKFTPDGGWIGVTAHRVDGEVSVSVKDSGIGIAPEDQAKVFDEFQQVGKASDRSREGTGLGLTLAKRFIELHGGRIWLESEVGKGTTFTFAIPVGRAAAAPA